MTTDLALDTLEAHAPGFKSSVLQVKTITPRDLEGVYGLTEGEGPLGRALTRQDWADGSAYNTYQIEGLPPGPIANPGRASIAAVLDPADVDYLYFVANGKGGHAFARTLAEHNRNVAAWRRLQAGDATPEPPPPKPEAKPAG